MNHRSEILNQLRRNSRPATLPEPWQSQRNFPDLADRFTTALTSVKGEVHRADNLEMATSQLEQILTDLGTTQVVINNVPPVTDLALPTRWPQFKWHVAGETQGDLKSFCAQAEVGISGAIAALAETGSIVINSGPQQSRLATLLPTVHIAFVPTSILTTDLFTWTAARQGKLPANVVLVTGPSKTADIGMVLSIGVHGPKRFIVLLYEG